MSSKRKSPKPLEGAITLNEARQIVEQPSSPPSPPVPEPSCHNCPFWYRVNDSSGKCRYFPPGISDPKQITSYGPILIHGLTLAEEVCGQHPHFKK